MVLKLNMNRNCYIQIREFGRVGWNKFLPALFLSDRVDTWLPSGDDLRAAHEAGDIPFSESEFISLIEEKAVRIGGRAENLLSNTDRKVFNRAGKSLLDGYLEKAIERNSDFLILHEKYNSSEIAFNEICSREAAGADSYYGIARSFVNRHLSGIDCLPHFVLERASQFASLDFDEIEDVHIRECMRLLRSDIVDKEERWALQVCSQLIRLSLEHDAIMRKHDCQVHFALKGYADTFRTVAKAKTLIFEPEGPMNRTIEKIIELIEFLLVQNPVRDAFDFLERRKKIAKYRETIWSVTPLAGDIERHILREIRKSDKNLKPIESIFGKPSWIDGASFTQAVTEVIGALVEGITLANSVLPLSAFGLALAGLARNVNIARQGRPEYWPAVLVYDTRKPSREQIRALVKDLEYFIRKRQI